MILVEDENVESSIVKFGNRLYDFDQLTDINEMQASMKELREYAHGISYSCRDSIDQGIRRKSPSVRLRKDMRD